MFDLSLKPNQTEEQVCKYIGYAATIMSNNPKYMQFQFASIKNWIRIPIVHEQFKFFFDKYGFPIGFITWASISKSTFNTIVNDADYILHPSEWNDGDIIWIMDFCVNQGYFHSVFKSIKEYDFNSNYVYSAKRRIDGSIIRIKKWK